jgi:hypothetical protein
LLGFVGANKCYTLAANCNEFLLHPTRHIKSQQTLITTDLLILVDSVDTTLLLLASEESGVRHSARDLRGILREDRAEHAAVPQLLYENLFQWHFQTL